MQTPTQKLCKVTHFCVTLRTLRLKKIPDDDSGIFTNSIKYYIISRNSFKVIYFFHSFCHRGASLNNLGSGASLYLSSSGASLYLLSGCKLVSVLLLSLIIYSSRCKLEQFGIRCKLEPFIIGCKLVSVFLSSQSLRM